MIAPLPGLTVTTRDDYSSPAYDAQPFVNFYNVSQHAVDPEYGFQRAVILEQLAQMQASRTTRQCTPLNLNRSPINIHLFRGSDLRYASHVQVPAAESIENF